MEQEITPDEEIAIFDSPGTALPDVAAAVYERPLASGRGVTLELDA